LFSVESEKQTLVEEKVKKKPDLGSWFTSFVNSAKQKVTSPHFVNCNIKKLLFFSQLIH
jgi:hypothetical protein